MEETNKQQSQDNPTQEQVSSSSEKPNPMQSQEKPTQSQEKPTQEKGKAAQEKNRAAQQRSAAAAAAAAAQTAAKASNPPIDTPSVSEEDDDVATREEMEAFIESRRKSNKERATQRSKESSEEQVNPEVAEYEQQENAIDPYLEPDPTLPWVEFKEGVFLSRGCNKCPEAYKPVSETEVRSCSKVTSCNWMRGIRQPFQQPFDCVEVRFKNNRKEFFRLPEGIDVEEGDVVAVEGQPGHDVGVVSLTGESCRLQMKKKHVNPESEAIRRLFRRAKPADIERWAATLADEQQALSTTRRIVEQQGLQMKVNDVEFQGDGSKAIFYYTADERVDFRNLIKVLAEQFKVRVEMKQIGVRQEAGKVGGIGTCGRELCCSTWLTNFQSVTTGVAKAQQILPNPQKLAGQCGKLKCCLNFEYEVYVDALKKFPPAHTPIRFMKGLALYKKTDVLRGIMWYAYEGENELYALTAESVKQIIEMNRNQQYPEKLEDYQVELMSNSAITQESTDEAFEMELRRMADTSNEDGEEKQEKGRDDRRDGGERRREDRRDKDGDRRRGDRRDRNGDRRRDDRRRDDRRKDDRRNRDNNGERRENNNNGERRNNGGEGTNRHRSDHRKNKGEGNPSSESKPTNNQKTEE